MGNGRAQRGDETLFEMLMLVPFILGYVQFNRDRLHAGTTYLFFSAIRLLSVGYNEATGCSAAV